MPQKSRISPFTIITTFIALSITGIAVMPLLNLHMYPGRVKPGITVSYSMQRANAEVIDAEVTSKLEGVLSRVAGLQKLTSRTGSGSGRITLEMDKNADMDAVRFEVSALIRQVYPSLPHDVSYPAIGVNRPDEEEKAETLITFTFNGTGSDTEIGGYAQEYLVPALSEIEGVYAVHVYGAGELRTDLVYRKKVLDDIGLPVGEIRRQLREYYAAASLGQVYETDYSGNKVLVPVTFKGWGVDCFNAAKITIEHNGRLFRLTDLLEPRTHEQAPSSFYRINGLNTINVNVLSSPGANQIMADGLVRRGYPVIDAIHIGGKRRLKPIIMTSATTILAMIPFLWGDDMGSRLQQPLAYTIIGGMTIGTFVSLYFVPLAYYYTQKRKV
ncbi:MAG: efflux RND transporter permease subunit [Marinilabiliaceae bacterium]|nr:efflux RND transporter permease subunit [Marinilabiliaceae bacterium]